MTTCKDKLENGGLCPHHNLHCAFPACEKSTNMKHQQTEIPCTINDAGFDETYEWSFSGEHWQAATREDALIALKNGFQVRLKKIDDQLQTGELTIPKPIKYPPEDGEFYWAFCGPYEIARYKWTSSHLDFDNFDSGIWHSSEQAEAAQYAWRKFILG